MPLYEHYTHRQHLPAFFQCVHASQNVLFSSIWGSFPPVFVFALAYGSIRTHANSFLSMRTHPHHFLPNTPKHDVRGNFPGHSTQILVCDPINSPCLPWFCIAYAPCAPTHPCAPIPTHLNLFIPICTLHYMQIWCNLIKNQYSDSIKIQIFKLNTRDSYLFLEFLYRIPAEYNLNN